MNSEKKRKKWKKKNAAVMNKMVQKGKADAQKNENDNPLNYCTFHKNAK